MNQAVAYQPLQLQHQSINRWLVCGIYEEKMTFVPVTMEGEINSWLLEGFAIHENPCRKEFVEERRSAVPERPVGDRFPQPGESREEQGQWSTWELYTPWGNPKVERSGFYFVPTRLVSYAATQLYSPEAHEATFTLRTCGGVTLWANGEFIEDFVPYTRNMEKQKTIIVPLKQGLNRLEVRFEDLAERDTEYFFRLDYHGDQQVEIQLPTGDTAAAQVLAVEHALEQAYFHKETMMDGEIVLQLNNPLDQAIPVSITYGNFFDGVKTKTTVLQPQQTQLNLGRSKDVGMGFKYFDLALTVNDVTLRKLVGLEVHVTDYDLNDPKECTIEQRKAAALQCIAEMGTRNIHTAVAILKTEGSLDTAKEILLKGIERIEAREDCADFYLIGLFRLWRDYRDSGLFEEAFWDRVQQCIVQFRYWIDEPGDDVMWFFSENHALLFHACELLAGQWFPEAVFTNNGQSGAQHVKNAEQRLIHWFDRFFEEGLAEWNSNAYMPIDAVGFLHLYDLADSEVIRDQAKQAMDLLFYYMTLNAHDGRLMCTFGRSYEKELKGHYASGTTSMLWIGYGEGNINAYSISNTAFCLSDYAPPEAYADYLHPDDQGFTFAYEQGLGGYAKLYNYRTRSFTLSSIQDFRPGKKGYQEHVLHYAATPEAQLWVNHPGELHSYGAGRPCFWAGNGTLPKVGQYRGLAIMVYRIDPNHDADYTHAFVPIDEFDEWVEAEGWLAVRKNDAYSAVWAQRGLTMTKQGPNQRREWVSSGRDNVWLVQASNAKLSGSFEQFVEELRSMQVSVNDVQHVRVITNHGALEMGWESPFMLNGQQLTIDGSGVRGCIEKVR